jgi:hypothetical protein
MGNNPPPGPQELVPWWQSLDLYLRGGLTWENFFIALVILLVGMYARALWWRIKRVMREWA